jgi:hypothetical protein
MKTCKNCGGTELSWTSSCKNYSGVQDGLLKLNEIGAIFILGCEECSETLKIVDGDRIAEFLNSISYE